MFIVDTLLDRQEYHNKIDEAKTYYARLSESFDNSEILHIAQNMISEDAALAVVIGSLAENMQLDEFIVRKVNSKGEISRVKDRETRKRLATQTTGLSKARRREIARKVMRTKKANPGAEVKRARKFKKAMKRRAAYAI